MPGKLLTYHMFDHVVYFRKLVQRPFFPRFNVLFPDIT
jgi:hypothetical protein